MPAPVTVTITETNIGVEVIEEAINVSVTSVPIEVTISNASGSDHDSVTIGAPASGLSITGQVLSLALATALVPGALSSANWNTFNSKLSDAPSNGTTYGRKDGGWVAVTVAETDPIFIASSAFSIDAGDISNWNSKLSIESDPIFLISPAFTILLSDISNWNSKQAALGFTPVDIASINYIDLTDGGSTTLHSHTHTHAYEPIDATIVRTGQASWIDLTDGGPTVLHSHATVSLSWGNITGALSDQTDLQSALNAKQNSLTFPIASTLGGTGVNNAGTLTNASNTTITGGGTIALGGFTLTVPATGTVDLLGTAQTITATKTFTAAQVIDGSADQVQFTVDAHSTQTNDVYQVRMSDGTLLVSTTGIGVTTYLRKSTQTNVIRNVVIVQGGSTGTTAAGFGASIQLQLQTNTGVFHNTGLFESIWVDAATATRKAKIRFSAYDTVVRPGFDVIATGSDVDILFYGKLAFTQTDLNEYIDSLADGYLDIGATTAIRMKSNVSLDDGKNIIADTTTGTKIGTATTQKIGFWNATPVVQPAGIADADGTLADITTKFNSLITKLETLGLMATV